LVNILTSLHMIGRSTMNERSNDMIQNGTMLDYSVSPHLKQQTQQTSNFNP
jgi:hypothetical protein